MTQDSEIRPALTADEWTRARRLWPGIILNGDEGSISRHSLAAICLFEQPFGFTREDVEMIRHAAEQIRDEWGEDSETAKALAPIAAKIAALLPPE